MPDNPISKISDYMIPPSKREEFAALRAQNDDAYFWQHRYGVFDVLKGEDLQVTDRSLAKILGMENDQSNPFQMLEVMRIDQISDGYRILIHYMERAGIVPIPEIPTLANTEAEKTPAAAEASVKSVFMTKKLDGEEGIFIEVPAEPRGDEKKNPEKKPAQ